MYNRRHGGMWLKTLLKNVMYTIKTMMWMSTNVHQSAPLKRSTCGNNNWHCWQAIPCSDCWRDVWVLVDLYSREWYLIWLVMASCCSGGCGSKVHLMVWLKGGVLSCISLPFLCWFLFVVNVALLIPLASNTAFSWVVPIHKSGSTALAFSSLFMLNLV